MSDYYPGPPPDPGPMGSEDAGAAEYAEGFAEVDAPPPLESPAGPPVPSGQQPGAGAGARAQASPGAVPGVPGGPGAVGARPIAPKEYYSISEVCDLVGLKPHVLRYWESQFPVLNPSKNRSGNRVYQRKEIKLVLLVQHLLYKEKYTIEGARQKLDQLRRGKSGELGQATSYALDAEMRKLLRDELTQLLDVLSGAAPASATAAAGEEPEGAAGPEGAPGAAEAGLPPE